MDVSAEQCKLEARVLDFERTILLLKTQLVSNASEPRTSRRAGIFNITHSLIVFVPNVGYKHSVEKSCFNIPR